MKVSKLSLNQIAIFQIKKKNQQDFMYTGDVEDFIVSHVLYGCTFEFFRVNKKFNF